MNQHSEEWKQNDLAHEEHSGELYWLRLSPQIMEVASTMTVDTLLSVRVRRISNGWYQEEYRFWAWEWNDRAKQRNTDDPKRAALYSTDRPLKLRQGAAHKLCGDWLKAVGWVFY